MEEVVRPAAPYRRNTADAPFRSSTLPRGSHGLGRAEMLPAAPRRRVGPIPCDFVERIGAYRFGPAGGDACRTRRSDDASPSRSPLHEIKHTGSRGSSIIGLACPRLCGCSRPASRSGPLATADHADVCFEAEAQPAHPRAMPSCPAATSINPDRGVTEIHPDGGPPARFALARELIGRWIDAGGRRRQDAEGNGVGPAAFCLFARRAAGAARCSIGES